MLNFISCFHLFLEWSDITTGFGGSKPIKFQTSRWSSLHGWSLGEDNLPMCGFSGHNLGSGMVWTSIACLGLDSSASGFAGQQCPLTLLDGSNFQLENQRFSSFLTMKNIGQKHFFLVPSGELTFCHGKSPFLMGKSTISMAIFNCFL